MWSWRVAQGLTYSCSISFLFPTVNFVGYSDGHFLRHFEYHRGDLAVQICFLSLGVKGLALDDLQGFSSSKILSVCMARNKTQGLVQTMKALSH